MGARRRGLSTTFVPEFDLAASRQDAQLTLAEHHPDISQPQAFIFFVGALRLNQIDLMVTLAETGWLTDQSHNGLTALHVLVGKGEVGVEVAQTLLRDGADPNRADNRGWTPLHDAARRGDTAMVKVLLEWKANVSAEDARGRTAYDQCRCDDTKYILSSASNSSMTSSVQDGFAT